MSDPQVIYLYDFNVDGKEVKNWTAQSMEEVKRNKGFNVREYKMGQPSEVQQVTKWIDAAQQEPSVRNVANYLAYTMSELAECLKSVDQIAFTMLSSRLETFSLSLREAVYDDEIRGANRTELLDGAIDTAWCAIGLAHMLADAQGAFNEVAASNHSKFENGVCALDETGKVIKGPGYFKPDLAKYLR